MERLGFIHSKLEIKILILFVLNRLPHPVLLSDLTEAVMCDDGIGYFDYIEALTELIKTQHISEEKGYYSITQKVSETERLLRTVFPIQCVLRQSAKQ